MLKYRPLTRLCLATLLVALATPAAADPLSPALQARIDAIARRQLAVQHISGLTIGIGRSGKMLFSRGYGLRDRARHLPADVGTAYAIGSITKQFTAAATMLLVERQRVVLGSKLAHYLPGI